MKIQLIIYFEIIVIFFSEFLIAYIYYKKAKFIFENFFIGFCYRILNIVVTLLIGGVEHVNLVAFSLALQTTITGLYLPKIRKKMEKFKIEDDFKETSNEKK